MKTNRHLLSLVIGLTVFVSLLLVLPRTASAAGSVTYAKKSITEESGSWKIGMTIIYGGKPAMPHVPMRFSFTPTLILERYLDDAHGEKPQIRKIPLSGQLPLIETQDVDFSDPRGKIWDRTKFDFKVSRPHNFVAGEYSVTVKRTDGVQVGTTQTLVFNGENPVIDRRSITFIASDTGKKKGAGSGGNSTDSAPADKAKDTAPAAAPASSAEAPAIEKVPSGDQAEGASDPADLEKVPPTSHGCGCRTAGGSGFPYGVGVFAAAAFGLGLSRLRRRRGC
jgi:MYXO-CTERM domain-containing protein